MAPSTMSSAAATGRSRNSTIAATVRAEALAENISLWPGPATRWIHSHSTISARLAGLPTAAARDSANATAVAHKVPPTAPDQVFFGLTAGHNFGPPTA